MTTKKKKINYDCNGNFVVVFANSMLYSVWCSIVHELSGFVVLCDFSFLFKIVLQTMV